MIGRGVVAAIAGVGDAAVEHVADERLHLRNDRGERVPVIRVARQRCSMGDELTAGGMLHGGGDAHLDAELIRLVRLALADALHLRRVQAARSAASRRRSSASSNGGLRSSPSSATSRNTTAWAAITSPMPAAMPSMPCSLPPATTSAACSRG